MKQVSNLKALKGIEHGFYSALDSKEVVKPILMTQVHSADVLVLNEYTESLPQVDGLITKTAGLVLTAKSADCAPILLADGENKVIAAVHAGWKGAFQGVIESALLSMLAQGAKIQNIVAGVGPCLHLESFAVGPDMKALFPVTEHTFFHMIDGEEHFDFLSYVVHRLHRAGIQSVETIDIDTYSNKEYNSYRREASNPARQFSCIKLV